MILHPRSAGATPSVDQTSSGDGPLSGRVTAVLIGVTGLVGAIAFGSIVGVAHVERHLRSDVQVHALEGTGVDVRFHGRIAVLSGFVRSFDERRAVIDRVARRWGVARVDAARLTVRTRPRTPPALPSSLVVGAPDVRGAPRTSIPSTATATRTTVPAPPATSSAPPPAISSAPPPASTVLDDAAIGRLETELAAVRRASPITFARSSPTLLAGAQTPLDRIAAALAKTPVPIRIEAHTDASGDPGRNAVLSTQRAEAVRSALILRGVSPSIVSAIGRGESSPIASNTSLAGRERNRRIEFVVVRPVARLNP